MFCLSIALFSILPTLFAIMDDDLYVYVDDDVSFEHTESILSVLTDHIKAEPSTQAITPSPETPPTNSNCHCGT